MRTSCSRSSAAFGVSAPHREALGIGTGDGGVSEVEKVPCYGYDMHDA